MTTSFCRGLRGGAPSACALAHDFGIVLQKGFCAAQNIPCNCHVTIEIALLSEVGRRLNLNKKILQGHTLFFSVGGRSTPRTPFQFGQDSVTLQVWFGSVLSSMPQKKNPRPCRSGVCCVGQVGRSAFYAKPLAK